MPEKKASARASPACEDFVVGIISFAIQESRETSTERYHSPVWMGFEPQANPL
jgi:hypothetical protein